MKKIAIIVLSLVSVVLIQCQSGYTKTTYASDGNTIVKTSETETAYTLDATFKKEKAMEIYEHINSMIASNRKFAFEDSELNTNTSLDDGTTFHIEANYTELKITFDKESNSYESYKRVQELYEGVKKVVK